MSLPVWIRSSLTLPAICAPMFTVSGPRLVAEVCKAGVIGGLPRHNVRSLEEFTAWLIAIEQAVAPQRAAGRPVAPVAVNLSTGLDPATMAAEMETCARYGVRILISSAGHPGALIRAAHDHGLIVWHDVTSRHFAEKAIAAGADGLIAIASGGGGQSGKVSPLALIPGLRQGFDGTIVMAGAVANGAAIRAAEILGADLAYLGTRFIATKEAQADADYKAMIVAGDAGGIVRTDRVNGVPASWLAASLARFGIDPLAAPKPSGPRARGHLPEGAKPWKTIWSAGHGVELVDDIPNTADLIARLRDEYAAATAIAPFSAVADPTSEVERRTMLAQTSYYIGNLRHGGPEELARHSCPMPVPGEQQVLVKVHYSTVNPADILLRSGKLQAFIQGDPPYVGGLELSGTIIAVGAGSCWVVGDKVAAITSFIPSGRGSHRAHVVVDDASVAHIAEGYSMAQAAALPMSGLTAQLALDRARMAGSRIAITGATGAVGSLALRLALESGLDPVAVVRGSQRDAAYRLGARQVVASDDGPDAVLALFPGGVDAVIDAALLDSAIVPALRDGGHFIAVRATSFTPERGIIVDHVSVRDYQQERETLARLLKLAAQGRLDVKIAHTLPVSSAAKAHRLVQQGGQGGRVMLDFTTGKTEV